MIFPGLQEVCCLCLQDVYEQLVEREKRVKGQEASVSSALGERERSLQARQDQLASELQERERRLRSHEDECLATDRQLTADKAALDRARSDPGRIADVIMGLTTQ